MGIEYRRANTGSYSVGKVELSGDLRETIDSSGRGWLHVTDVGRYANVDSHLAAHQRPLILIRLSDYSRPSPMEMFRARKIIRSVW